MCRTGCPGAIQVGNAFKFLIFESNVSASQTAISLNWAIAAGFNTFKELGFAHFTSYNRSTIDFHPNQQGLRTYPLILPNIDSQRWRTTACTRR